MPWKLQSEYKTCDLVLRMRYQIIPVTHYQQNCSVVWNPESRIGAVIDPGGEADKILAFCKNNDIRLEKILLTHGHMDHVGATAELAKKLNVPIIGPHIADKYWIDALAQQAAMMGFTPVANFQPDTWLQHGDTVAVGEIIFGVLHCPGHTPGHIVLYNAANKIAFVGDVLFNGSIGRSDFPGGNHQQLLDSIRQKLWPLGDDIDFVPGHGPMSTFGEEKRSNPFVADPNYG